METKRIYIDACRPDPSAVRDAAELLRSGQVVAFPTETVYGLGANAWDAGACAKIFEAKGRPQDNPLIVHVADRQMAESLAGGWTEAAERCVAAFWPGPLTLVLPKNPAIPDLVTAGLATVAIRFPAHPVAQALIAAAGVPVAAPSANLSGKPSPTNGRHVWRDLRGKIPLILDAGACRVGLESTVLDLSGEVPMILRPGGVSPEQLAAVLGQVELDSSGSASVPKAPGMKYRHYAPQGEMLLVLGPRDRVLQRITEEIRRARSRLKTVGILCTLESAPQLHSELPDLLFVLGSESRPEEVASNLFEGLRLCDERHVDLVLAEGVERGGIGLAIMNRLEKAAGHRIIQA